MTSIQLSQVATLLAADGLLPHTIEFVRRLAQTPEALLHVNDRRRLGHLAGRLARKEEGTLADYNPVRRSHQAHPLKRQRVRQQPTYQAPGSSARTSRAPHFFRRWRALSYISRYRALVEELAKHGMLVQTGGGWVCAGCLVEAPPSPRPQLGFEDHLPECIWRSAVEATS